MTTHYSFEWLPVLFKEKGFPEAQPPYIIQKDYPDWQAMGLVPKVVKNGYSEDGFYWHRNLYHWMGISIDLMAQVHKNEIHVYQGVLALLAQRFRTLLKAPEPEVLESLTRLATMHGMAQYYVQQLALNTEGGWVIEKHRGIRGSGHLDRFYAWVLYTFSEDNALDRAAVDRFLKMALNQCNINDLKARPREAVFQDFVKYFLSHKAVTN